MKEKLIIGGVILALLIGGMAFSQTDSVDVNVIANNVYTAVVDKLGANSGPDHYQKQYFFDGFESGGVGTSQASTTLAVSTTLQISDWGTNQTYIEYTPTIGAVTLTTVASTTFPIGAQRGSQRELWLYNATTTTDGASVITLAAGTGIDLQEDTGQVVTFAGLEGMRVTFIRKADSDILMFVEATQVGD